MGIRRVSAINFIDQSIAAALAVIVPLLLLQRNIPVAEIGLILSALPLIFLFARMLFAALADQSGFRNFFIVDWLAQVVSIAIYLFAGTPLAFIFGKVAEGVRTSAFWAVNRTAIFYYAPGKEAAVAVRLSAIRTAGSAIGTAIAGAVAALFGLHYALLVLLIGALAQGFPAVSLKPYRNGGFSVRKTFSLLLPFGKGKRFWLASLALSLYAFAVYPIFNLIAPVYMRLDLSLGYDVIGFVVAGYYLLNTVATWAGLRYKVPFGRLAILQALLFAAGCVLIPITGSLAFIPLFLILAVGDGLSLVMFEAMVARLTRGKSSVSTDIGFLHAPYRVAEFSAIIFAGFAFQYVGYSVVFAVSALSFAAYSFLAWRILR